MLIYLYDNRNNSDVHVNVIVDYSVTIQDTLIAFYSKDQTCGLDNNRNSSPYDEYVIRKLTHLVVGSFEYVNEMYTVALAAYLNDFAEFKYCLVKLDTKSGKIRFDNPEVYDDNHFTDFKILNFKEFNDFKTAIGKPLIKFNEYLMMAFSVGFNNHFCLYDIHSNMNGSSDSLLTKGGFEEFLNAEESK